MLEGRARLMLKPLGISTMKELERLGPPSLKIEGFALLGSWSTVLESQGFYDGNWLNVAAHCGARGATVWVEDTEQFGEPTPRRTTTCGFLDGLDA